LHGAILAKDKSGSLQESCEAYEHWNVLVNWISQSKKHLSHINIFSQGV